MTTNADTHRGLIETAAEAVRFMKSVKFALRYNATADLPLSSMHAAARNQRRAIELTNALLASGEVIETNVIANRLVLAHRDIVPALYALRVRYRAARLSENAERAFKLIQEDGSVSVGDMRRFLEMEGMKRPDPADLAVAELMRELLVDRGPASVPKTGILYLGKEGYPYRVFEKARPNWSRLRRRSRSKMQSRPLSPPFQTFPRRRSFRCLNSVSQDRTRSRSIQSVCPRGPS
jgi:hypothetical protein